MSPWIRHLALVLAVFGGRGLATAAPDASETKAVEEAVLEVHQQMNSAVEALDVDGFFGFILDAARGPVIQDGRLFADRDEAREAVRRGFQGVARVERVYETTDVTVISEKAALLTGKGTSTITLEDGRVLDGPFAVSLVFVLTDDGWRVLHGHYSIPSPR
jgi:ketosteroid isomerase-like protein